MTFDIREYIHQSNLIENIDDPKEDKQSLKAWKFIEKQPYINEERIRELQKLITQNQLPKHQAGWYRTSRVMVGDRVCPEPYLAAQMIWNWAIDMHSYWKTLDPKAMHIRFEHIHPFIDGNGRTGRMLMWWHEVKLGKEPTLISFHNRRAYYDWF